MPQLASCPALTKLREICRERLEIGYTGELKAHIRKVVTRVWNACSEEEIATLTDGGDVARLSG